jgi:hypothetical protein
MSQHQELQMKTRSWIVLASLTAIGFSLSVTPDAAAQNQRRGAGPEGAPLKVGDEAPSFTLKSLDGKEEFELDSARANGPVILIFGSYT